MCTTKRDSLTSVSVMTTPHRLQSRPNIVPSFSIVNRKELKIINQSSDEDDLQLPIKWIIIKTMIWHLCSYYQLLLLIQPQLIIKSRSPMIQQQLNTIEMTKQVNRLRTCRISSNQAPLSASHRLAQQRTCVRLLPIVFVISPWSQSQAKTFATLGTKSKPTANSELGAFSLGMYSHH